MGLARIFHPLVGQFQICRLRQWIGRGGKFETYGPLSPVGLGGEWEMALPA